MFGAVHEYRMLILEAHLRFARELHNRQAVTIRSWLESFTIGLFDLAARRLIRPTPEWARALGLRLEDLGAAGGGGR